jgi:hypothetical protein
MQTPIVYDVRNRVVHNQDPHGLSGYMSFERLAAYLEDAECRPGEVLTHIVISSRGIDLRVRRVDTSA